MSLEARVGIVTHYYNHIGVAVITLEQTLRLGDKIYFLGSHTDFGQELDSIQIEHHRVVEGYAGEEVAVKVWHRVRPGDVMYRVSELDEAEESFKDSTFQEG